MKLAPIFGLRKVMLNDLQTFLFGKFIYSGVKLLAPQVVFLCLLLLSQNYVEINFIKYKVYKSGQLILKLGCPGKVHVGEWVLSYWTYKSKQYKGLHGLKVAFRGCLNRK